MLAKDRSPTSVVKGSSQEVLQLSGLNPKLRLFHHVSGKIRTEQSRPTLRRSAEAGGDEEKKDRPGV